MSHGGGKRPGDRFIRKDSHHADAQMRLLLDPRLQLAQGARRSDENRRDLMDLRKCQPRQITGQMPVHPRQQHPAGRQIRGEKQTADTAVLGRHDKREHQQGHHQDLARRHRDGVAPRYLVEPPAPADPKPTTHKHPHHDRHRINQQVDVGAEFQKRHEPHAHRRHEKATCREDGGRDHVQIDQASQAVGNHRCD